MATAEEGQSIPMDTNTSCADKVDPCVEPMEVSDTAPAKPVSESPQETRLTSQGLNALILQKLAAAFACDGDLELAKLKDRILEAHQTKDKMCQKLITMQKQVEEVTKALIENSEYMANPTESSPPAPLKFFRSVGLQVNTESRAQLSLQNSNSLRTKENTVPFKRNGVLVGPASVKRNYANKMSETTPEAVPSKKPSPSSSTATRSDVVNLVGDANSLGSKANGSTGIQVLNMSDGQARSFVLQSAQGTQGAANVGNAVLRTPTTVKPGGTVIRPATPRAGSTGRFQVGSAGSQPVRSKFALPPPPPPSNNNNISRQDGKELPPRPELTLKSQSDGIVLSWTHPLGRNHPEISNYQIFACQESLNSTRGPVQWKRVGDVKALPLPMACTLSQFTDENRYHFIVRGVDAYNRTGPFCETASIVKKRNN